MKIRIRDNSIRLRLSRSEVDVVREKGVLSSNIRFPGGRELRYVLESSPASVSTAVSYSDDAIIVCLPETTVLAWATTERVSIQGEQVLDDGGQLRILVEKDYECLKVRAGEDESDMFANPNDAKVRC